MRKRTDRFLAVFVGHFKIAVVEVDRRDVRITWMDDGANASSKEWKRSPSQSSSSSPHLLDGLRWEVAVYDRDVDASFFERLALLQDARHPTAAF